MPAENPLEVTGIEWSALDERAQAVLRPLIDSGVLVTYVDETSRSVRLTFAATSVAGASQRVREFVSSNAEFLAWRERLHARASLWRLGGEPAELLLPEDETRTALRWKTERQAELSAVELAFVEESLKSQRGFAAVARTAAAAAATVTAPVLDTPVPPPPPKPAMVEERPQP